MAKTLTDRLDRARSTAQDVAHDVQDRLADLGDDARTRSRELAAEARDRSAPLRESARERAGELGEQARDRARDRAQGLVDAAHRGTPSAAESVGDLVAAITTALAAVPLLLARLLRLAGVWVDRAADQGRDLAAGIEPSRRVRRRRRTRAAAWAGGAFGLGFVAGWFVHDRLHQGPEAPYLEDGARELEPDEDAEVEDEVAAARRRAESDAS